MFKESQIPFGNKRKVANGIASILDFPGKKNRILTRPDDFFYVDSGCNIPEIDLFFPFQNQTIFV